MIKRHFLNLDWGIFLPALILVAFSLTVLFSVNPIFFRSQFTHGIIALLLFFAFSQMHHKTLRVFTLPVYITSIIFLTFILLVGIESRGAVRWVDILGIRIQFSEIFKPLLIISFASFLSEKQHNSFKTFAISVLLLIPVSILVYLQPDLGNALIYVGIAGMMMLVFGFPFLWFFIGMLPVFFSMPILWNFLHDYQKQRILTFLAPSQDPLGTSYNVIQAVIAVGSGMMTGRGLGQGTQSVLRFLPERQTDFIFATLSEGLGFVGGFLIIALFSFLLYRIYRIYKQEEDSFSKLVAAGGFALIFIQFFVNIGMNLGILPIVGVTLPFVSFGGSSLVASFIMLGILSSISTSHKKHSVLEIR